MILILICQLLFWGVRWVLSVWQNITADELVYHLMAPIKGTNRELIKDGILSWGVPALITVAVVIAGYFIIGRFFGRTTRRRVFTGCILLSLLAGTFSVYRLDRELRLFDYFRNSAIDSDFIEQHYVPPQEVELTFPEQRRNLVYIYLESVEVTFADRACGGIFENNVIPELTGIALENEDFSGDGDTLNGALALPGSTYTMGALWAQSSGMPIKLDVSINDMDTQSEFFPAVMTLGDILEEHGYVNELIVGSDADFGGRALYYRTHGNYRIFDYNEAIAQGRLPSGYHRWWGFEDEKLFSYAREELTALASTGEPFNLTILTADTHFEDGYVCDLCTDEFGDDQYSNVYACSSRQVAEFVEWISQQPYYENTTIVLSGDHPTMDADYCEQVPWDYSRRTYTAYINAAVSAGNAREARLYSTMDNFPTTLAALGVDIPGDRLGLGTNLFSDTPTLLETYGVDVMTNELSRGSEFMRSLNRVEINDSYLARLRERSDLYLYDDDGKLRIELDTYTKLTNGALIDSIEADVTVDGKTVTVPLTGFRSEGNIFYNIDEISLGEDGHATVDVYFISDTGERYIIEAGDI